MCTCWYRVPQYLYHRTLPPTGAHYFKRYKKNINLYYLPPFIDKKPCPAHYLQKIYIFFFIKLFIPIYRLETLPCPLFSSIPIVIFILLYNYPGRNYSTSVRVYFSAKSTFKIFHRHPVTHPFRTTATLVLNDLFRVWIVCRPSIFQIRRVHVCVACP